MARTRNYFWSRSLSRLDTNKGHRERKSSTITVLVLEGSDLLEDEFVLGLILRL